MSLSLRRIFIVVFVVLLFGCASDLRRDSVEMSPLEPGKSRVIKVTADVSFRLSSGYSRTIAANSEWRSVGRISSGTVFQPVGRVFSIEGAHVHEAYLVLQQDYLVGFYLPGEQKVSMLDPPVMVKTD